jgi:DNA-directed RNA polymerase subunit M
MYPSDDNTWQCKRCGAKKSLTPGDELVVRESMEVRKSEFLIVDSEIATLPKTSIECPQCSHTEAYWVIRQTRAADEPETRIYRCVKCAYTWREY